MHSILNKIWFFAYDVYYQQVKFDGLRMSGKIAHCVVRMIDRIEFDWRSTH